MKLACLYSGGKDSNLALLKAKELNYDITCLINLKPPSAESFMFHFPNAKITKLQAKTLDLPLIQVKTKGKKEEELNDLKKAINQAKKKFKIQGIITGAVKSTYQASRIEKICHGLKLWVFSPLWLKDEVKLLKELKEKKIKTVFSRISGYPLTKKFVKKELINYIDYLEKNKKIINPAAEGGEYETLVLDMPLFKKKIKIKESSIKSFKENEAELIIKKAELLEK